MLNIPSTIKALYMTEGRTDIRKNFRVTFPNGEYSDINSDQILTESVKFTESIMSQSTFRFGLAEAPQIQFETVGVGNMLGMTIECWHEIETTSLSTAQISAIQGGTWDGELVLAADSDLGYGFFRIPLGVFFVDSCPRNHGALTHRRVVAYGTDLGKETNLSPFYQFVIRQLYTGKTWRLYPDFFYANLYYNDRGILNKFTNASSSLSLNTYVTADYPCTLAAGQPYNSIHFWGGYKYYGQMQNYGWPGHNDGMKLVRIEGMKTAIEAVRRDLRDWLDSIGVSLVGATFYAHPDPFVSQDEGITTIINTCFNRAYVGFHTGVSPNQEKYYVNPTSDFIQILVADTPNVVSGYDAAAALVVPAFGTIDAQLNGSGSNISVIAADTPLITSCSAYDLTTPTGASVIPDMGLSTSGIEVSGSYQYSKLVDYMDILTGLVEMNAEFGAIGRDGAVKLVALDPTSPITLSPSEYSELWYDEYDVSPIGAVDYKMITGEEVETIIGSGLSTYDMGGNALIDMAASISDVETMLSTNFAPRATSLDFVPIELNAKGLPWVEPGDPIQITTEDGETVTSYVLERTITGIQVLSDDIRASGGDLIGTLAAGY